MLKEYTNILTRIFVEEQVIFYPNEKRVVDLWIVTAGELFTRFIVEDYPPITYMPPVQLSILLDSNENTSIEYIQELSQN